MKQIFTISSWEFIRHFKSKSFFLATFITPLIFVLILLIPSWFIKSSSGSDQQIIGCVEFGDAGISEEIRGRLLEMEKNSDGSIPFLLKEIQPDTSEKVMAKFAEQSRLFTFMDSLKNAYNKIKERRKYIYQKPKTPAREALLKQTYNELIETREAKDLAQFDYQMIESQNDSLWRAEAIRKADEMLFNEEISGFLLIEPEEFKRGVVEFYSVLPENFLDIQPLKQALQITSVEQKMKQENIQVGKIRELLHPVHLRKIQLRGENKQEFNLAVNYLGPIVVVLFLFVSIFSSSGFLFSGIIKEKTNRVIELLLSSVNHTQLVAGKILGLGLLGLFQILIWFGILFVLLLLKIVDFGEIGFFSPRIALLFLVYFSLGYLFFASLFVGLGSLFSSEEDAHHLNQFMRTMSIFPIVLAWFVLESPNSLLVKILSFIPPFTPTFMILRTPLGNPPASDYYISIGIMVVSIVVSVFLAGRLFRLGSLLYGKKITVKELIGSITGKI